MDNYTVKDIDNINSTSIQDTCKPSPIFLSFKVGNQSIIRQAYRFVGGVRRIKNHNGNFTTTVLSDINLDDKQYDFVDLINRSKFESIESVHKKERYSGLEYSNTALYNKNVKKYDTLFSNVPHTFMLTKLHELGNKNDSSLFADIAADYLTNALLYRAALNHLNFAVHISNGDDIDLWFLDGREAIGLMDYCITMKSIGNLKNHPEKKHLIPKSPMDSVIIRRAFDITLPRYPEIKEFYNYGGYPYLGKPVRTDKYINVSAFDSMPLYRHAFTSIEEMEETFSDELNFYMRLYIERHTNPETISNYLIDKIMEPRTVYRSVHNLYLLGSIKDATTGEIRARTYDEYFAEHTEIKTVFDRYLSEDGSDDNYDGLFELILDSMFPTINENEYISGVATIKVRNKIKQLFRELCSYHINFIDEDKITDTYTMTLPGYMDNGLITDNYGFIDYTKYEPTFSIVNNFIDACETRYKFDKYGRKIAFTVPLHRDNIIPSNYEFVYDMTMIDANILIPSHLLSDVVTPYRTWVKDFVPVNTYQIIYRVNSVVNGIWHLHGDKLCSYLRALLTSYGKPITIPYNDEYKYLSSIQVFTKNSDNTVTVRTDKLDYIQTLLTGFENDILKLDLTLKYPTCKFSIEENKMS